MGEWVVSQVFDNDKGKIVDITVLNNEKIKIFMYSRFGVDKIEFSL